MMGRVKRKEILAKKMKRRINIITWMTFTRLRKGIKFFLSNARPKKKKKF